MKKMFKRIATTLIVIVLAITCILIVFLHQSLPKIEGTLKLEILQDKVIVSRDQYGVASIEASNESDLFKAQGFIQAQDRLFQMDLARRQASGRLSEVVGEKALENDKKFLVYSLRKAAETSFPSYSPKAKQVLKDFKDGVNAYIQYAIENNKLPYEFTLLGYQPELWSEIDSLTIGKYMAYDLGGHYSYQAFNNVILNQYGKEEFISMNQSAIAKDKDIEEIIQHNLQTSMMIDSKTANIESPDPSNGSNNWVLSGKKTKTKKPLLADDPHLSLSTPSIWYQMTLKTIDMNVSGVIFAGIPGIILGHNEHIAWGVTNYGPDVQDLYIEKQHPENKYQFLYDNQYYDAEVITHQIKIKNKPTQSFETIYTKNGPIMNELLKSTKVNTLFSMRWTALEATNELEAILQLNKAKNWNEFEFALNNFKAPAQNFVFADKEGNIGFKSNGNIPIRNKGNAILPAPGYLSEYSWKGYIPFDKLPKVYNPESGYIASANTNTIPTDYHISNIWAQPYRKIRIDEVLESKNDFTPQDMKDLQMDVKNLYAKQFLPLMLQNVTVEKEVQEIFNQWNYFDKKEEVAPLIFHEWMIQTRKNLFGNLLNEDLYKFMPYKEQYGDEILWNSLNNKKNMIVEKSGGIKTLLQKSYDETIQKLKTKYGNTINDWKWKKNHRLLFPHPIGSANPILNYFLTPKSKAIDGAHVSVQAAKQDEFGNVKHGASWRYVYDFETNTGHHIVGPGQSGHFLSPYYKNQVDNWVEGIYNPVNLSQLQIKHTLVLQP